MTDLQDYIDHVLADSPLLYWPLQETSGNAQDATANNRDGTLTTGGLWVPTNPQASRGNKCFYLPAGNNGSVYLEYGQTLDTNAGNGMSVEFWLKPAAINTSTEGVMRASDGTSHFTVTTSFASGDIRFSTSGSSGRIAVAQGAPNNYWAYWVFTQDSAGSSRVYKNGVLVGGPSSQTPGTDFPNFRISNGLSSVISMNWQHVAVFNTVLSATRIAERWALQTDELHEIVSRDQFPVTFPTLPLVPLNVGGTGGAPPPTEGQLWPRGNP